MSDDLTRIIQLESQVNQLHIKVRELEMTLENERKIHIKLALHADRMLMQLQAIREAAIGELCGSLPMVQRT
jgi:hypothetical protein